MMLYILAALLITGTIIALGASVFFMEMWNDAKDE